MKARKTTHTKPNTAKPTSSVVVHAFSNSAQDREFDQLLEHHHYLGACPPVGDYLRQWAFKDGELVALLSWGPCCYQLKARDEHIGWDKRRATERLKWIAQNRRYLLLTPKGKAPNLASQVLGAAARVLPDQWERAFGHRPLAAESFSDIEAYAGTAYKASGWAYLGDTKGYSRSRAEFFARNGRPKKVWFKPLQSDALERLCDPVEPGQSGADTSAHAVLPLRKRELESLYDFLRGFPDPRASNRSYPAHSMLCLIVMAMLAGRKDVMSILRFGQSLSQAQRKELGMPFKKGTRFRKVPGYRAIRNLLEKIDPAVLAGELNGWLSSHRDRLPGAMALDGKMIKDVAGVVSLVDAETGVPIAMAPMRHKEEGPDGEATCARDAVADAGPLEGRVLTGDAGNTNVETATQVLDQGGEYLLQLKGNQPNLHPRAIQATATAPFLTSAKNGGMAG